jgi:hypothetical protein
MITLPMMKGIEVRHADPQRGKSILQRFPLNQELNYGIVFLGPA